MGRPIRLYTSDGIYFVTARTLQGRLLLRPSARTNEVVAGVLGRAVRRYPVELHAYVVASNHLHLLLRARDGCLSAFMQFLLNNIARKVGHIVRWRGAFWERRFSAETVVDDDAAVGRLRYILAHGVKEGLVRRARDWPGLSCLEQLLSGAMRVTTWFHWALRWRGRRLRHDALDIFDPTIAEEIVLELTPLPAWSALSQQERGNKVNEILRSIEEEARARHPEVRGVAAVLREQPHRRPAFVKRSPRPLCHASTREAWWTWRCVYRAFRHAYEQASVQFRLGDVRVPFPAFAFRPPLIPGITIPLTNPSAA